MFSLPEKPLPYGELITADLIEAVVDRIVRNIHPLKIIVFGSCAYGTPNPDSDLDILIVQPTDLPRHERTMPIHRLFNPAPCSMDILVFTPEEIDYWNGTTNHIITEAFQRGKVYHEQERSGV